MTNTYNCIHVKEGDVYLNGKYCCRLSQAVEKLAGLEIQKLIIEDSPLCGGNIRFLRSRMRIYSEVPIKTKFKAVLTLEKA